MRTRVNKIEVMYERPRVLKVEGDSTFVFTRDLTYIASIYLPALKFRLRAVPQDGHASEEIERSERNPRGSWGGGASLQFLSRPIRSLQSCRA